MLYYVINVKEEVKYYEVMYEKLFENYLKALENKDLANDIYSVFLKDMSNEYISGTSDARKVIDYIAGMTDDYFINRYNEIANIKVKR